MRWSFVNNLPIYVQLMDQLKMEILSGGLSPGERLLSVRELAAQAGVNPNTMQKALSELEREGYLVSQRTSGRFVREDGHAFARAREQLAQKAIADFLGKMRAIGFDYTQVVQMTENFARQEVE